MAAFFEGLFFVLIFMAVGAVVTLKLTSTFRPAHTLLKRHFGRRALKNLVVTQRTFPTRVKADVQRALDDLLASDVQVAHFSGASVSEYDGPALTNCISTGSGQSLSITRPDYDEVDLGEDQPLRCLKNGFWLLEKDGVRLAVLYAPTSICSKSPGMVLQVAAPDGPAGAAATRALYDHVETTVRRSPSYRGKILSLESLEDYTGQSICIKVHQLRSVERDQVILPQKTLELLDRNVIGFVKQREKLAQYGQATKKGLLFYGPPGTGKTHTIHYLTRSLKDHTTLLVTAEQVGLLAEYMILARLLQPSIVVLEDVDLIGRDRSQMHACEEVILNQLLNEMDGLREGADILFILTTNRPEALERALASRPGRVDQAIEFPLPDEEGRAKLMRLYARGIAITEDIVEQVVQRTGSVSAAFIKELMRRSVQFHLERNGDGNLRVSDMELALEEMLFSGGALNLKLLGAEDAGNGNEVALGAALQRHS